MPVCLRTASHGFLAAPQSCLLDRLEKRDFLFCLFVPLCKPSLDTSAFRQGIVSMPLPTNSTNSPPMPFGKEKAGAPWSLPTRCASPVITNAFRQESPLFYNPLIPCRQQGSQVRSSLACRKLGSFQNRRGA